MRSRRSQRTTPDLLSKQVSEAAYFFLNLTPTRVSDYTVCAGGRERCNPDYLIRRRKYGYTVLEFVASGLGHVLLDGIKFPLKAGAVFSYQQDTVCEIHTDPHDCLVKYFICLAGRNAPTQLKQAGVRTASATQLASHTEIQSLFAHLVREGQAHTKFSQEICDTLLNLILLKIRESLAQPGTAPQAGREKFLHVKQVIDARAAELKSLDEVARFSGVAPVAACKLFNQHLGLSPFRYLMRRKMEIAAEHLMQHGGLIKEAAAQVGFSDPYHFSRRFRHAHGVAPTKMRRLQQH
ncbi:helix-turn-helix domain-containing protein [Oleiharenicola lentus]|uniref:helix-turn-helix domain-containing protein n=1 Tax=Oleiharenicola lentus TaxID=2508720 RepID=UPI003F6723D4